MRNWMPAAFLGLSVLLATPTVSFADGAAPAAEHAAAKHRIVVQVSDNDPKKWNLALNNVANLQKALGKDQVSIEVVAYGPGINMLKLDSKVGGRVGDAVAAGVKISGCQNTMHAMHLNKEDMLADISYVPSGVVELVERQEAGYAYIRP